MNNEKPDKETLDQWHNNPDNWIFGFIYYNKEDKRIFPPKRLAFLGWTVNLANPYSILVFVVFLVIVAGAAKYFKWI